MPVYLAKIDSLHRPPRGSRLDLPARAAVSELQADFHRLGLPIHTTGTAAERKTAERQWRRLECRGFVTIHRRQNRVGVRLVDEAEWSVRPAVGFSLSECLSAMCRLAAAEAEGFYLGSGGLWIPECLIAGVPWNWQEGHIGRIIDLQDTLAGGLCRGWVVSNSGTNSRAWYALTTLGREVLANPPKATRERRYSSQLNDVYESGVDAMNHRIATHKLQHENHIGQIPLPATFWTPNAKLEAAILLTANPLTCTF